MPKDKDDVQTTLSPETLELLKQFKAMMTDPDDEERKREERVMRAAARAQKDTQQQINRAQEQNKLRAMEIAKTQCSHQRKDGTYNLHGQRFGDGVIRFLCPQCGGKFAPGDPQYNSLIKYIDRDRLGNSRQAV